MQNSPEVVEIQARLKPNGEWHRVSKADAATLNESWEVRELFTRPASAPVAWRTKDASGKWSYGPRFGPEWGENADKWPTYDHEALSLTIEAEEPCTADCSDHLTWGSHSPDCKLFGQEIGNWKPPVPPKPGEAVGKVHGSFRVLDGTFGHCVVSALRLEDGTPLYTTPPAPAESAAPSGVTADTVWSIVRPYIQSEAQGRTFERLQMAFINNQPQPGRVEKALRDALAYVGQRTDGDLATIAERAELWMRESKCLLSDPHPGRVESAVLRYKRATEAVSDNPKMLLSDSKSWGECAAGMQELESARESMFAAVEQGAEPDYVCICGMGICPCPVHRPSETNAEPAWLVSLRVELPLAPMKNSYWLTRDELNYLLGRMKPPSIVMAGVNLEDIQAALDAVTVPKSLSESKAEYWKAGARATIHIVNEVLVKAQKEAK